MHGSLKFFPACHMDRMKDKIFLLLILLTVWKQPLGAVAPPAPGVVSPPGFAGFVARRNLQYSANLNKRGPGASGARLAGVVSGRLAVPVILAAYADRQGVIEPEVFNDRFFGDFSTGSMQDYFSEVSRGLLELEGIIYGWVSVGLTQSQYTAGGPLGHTATYPESPEGFVADAVRAADRLVDYGLYDNDGQDGVPNSGDDDGVVDALLVIHPGGDAAHGDETNLWSHTGMLGEFAVETDDPAASGGRIRVDLYSIGPELSGDGGSPAAAEIGVFCHELCHQLGLVDLYDTSDDSAEAGGTPSNGIGNWGIMGHGSYGGDGASPQRPTHPCAWSKLRLGWVSPVLEDAVGEQSLPPVDTEPLVARLWDNNRRDFSYFLLSYRRRQGFDSRLPGEGLLIWHVDESQPDNQDPSHKLVDLEEADGLEDLDHAVNLGDDGDPFPGTANNTDFATLTSPSSARYTGAASEVTVTGIRLQNGQAAFNLNQPERSGLTLAYEQSPPEPAGFGYGDNLAYGAVVFTAPTTAVLEAVSTCFIYQDMSYNLELYTGEDNGVMRCLIHRQSGRATGSGWRTLEIEKPVLCEQADTLVVVIGYTSRGFDEGRPVPYDAAGAQQGKSLVDYLGLGAFQPFDHDLSIRAVLNTDYQGEDYYRVEPMLTLGSEGIDLGLCFSGENYIFSLPLANPGARNTLIERIEASGEGFILGGYELEVPCGSVLNLPLSFAAERIGDYSGTVTVVPQNESLPELEAALSAEIAGYSLRYDSTETPAGFTAITESAHGAVTFSMPERGLLAGVRVYLLQPFMNLHLAVWSEISAGRPRCLVAETRTDSLIQGPGWYQLFLDLPVDVDSGDTFIAEVEFTAPGGSYRDLVPADTLSVSRAVSYYNRREWESWLISPFPVSIRALVIAPGQAQADERILKRPEAAVSGALELAGLTVGREAAGGFWLVNRGTARYQAAISLEQAGNGFSLERTNWVVPCLDSVFVPVHYLPVSPGPDSALALVETTDKDSPGLEVLLSAAADRFELAYDELGATATAGFGDSSAWAAVIFTTPWPGLLQSVQVYFNRPGMRLEATVYRGMEAPGIFQVPLATLTDSLEGSGWQTVWIEPPLSFSGQDSFVVVASLTEPEGGGGYPLSLDTQGEPSGRSWAAARFEGPWEQLDYDHNLRAVFRTIEAEGLTVSGWVRELSGDPLPGVLVRLEGMESSYQALSDSVGAFFFGAVTPGNYRLSAELDGFSFEPPELLFTVSDTGTAGLVLVARESVPGDLDASGRVDIFDLIRLLQVLAGIEPAVGGDVDGNGSSDIFDLIMLLQLLAD